MRRASFLGLSVLLTIAIVFSATAFNLNSGVAGFNHPNGPNENGPCGLAPAGSASSATAATVQNLSGSGAPRVYSGVRAASVLPTASPLSASQGSSPPADWDEQLLLSFTQDFTSLAYNVTAVQQTDVGGSGPAYLLNGLTSAGYWYQVGLSWNWPYDQGGYNAGFHMNFQVFGPSGSNVFPVGTGGVDNIAGTVDPGDTVGLSLNFSGGRVIMSLYDFNTGASVSESYSAEGSSSFVGTPSASSNHNGYFTGLMTEQYHVSQYYGDESSVLYSDASASLSSAWMSICEFNTATSQTLFAQQTLSYYSGPSLQVFSSNGATESSNAHDFTTGSGDWVPMTMSYGVVGGGTPGAPTLSYFVGGIPQSSTLTESPFTYYMDKNSTWVVTSELTGGSNTESWGTQTTGGAVNSSQSLNIEYYHQYLLSFDYSSSAGTPSPPTVTIVQYGVTKSVAAPFSGYVDAGSQYSYANPVTSVSPGERWFTLSPQGTVLSSGTLKPVYYQQYAINASCSAAGGGNTGQIYLNGTSLGRPVSVALMQTPDTVWLDAGSNYYLPAAISGAPAMERWYLSSAANGSIAGPANISPVYQGQFYLEVGSNSGADGSVFPLSQWVASGQQVQINAVPGSGWQFEGWSGSGASSYNGSSSSDFLTMNSPVAEDALFCPGITVSAGNYGTVSYNYGQGSGSVTGGSSFVVAAPLNDTISLTANPTSFFYQFSQWSGAVNSKSNTITLAATAPGQIQADFVINWINVCAVAAAAITAGAIAGFTVLRKMKSRDRREPSLDPLSERN